MIDLHVHSIFSDGSLTPEQLAVEARLAKLSAVALTDHDSIDGVPRFLAACEKEGVRGVSGVEISVDGDVDSMHILGYFIDHRDPGLKKHLTGIRSDRDARNVKILDNLNGMGLALTMQEVGMYAGSDNIGRLHFAQALVARGYVQTREEAFDRFLAQGKPGYAGRGRLSPERGIEMIRGAGGLAVLAHPFTLGRNRKELGAIVEKLVDAGLAGIEVYYPQQNPAQMKCYRSIAARLNLVVTGGTDFHGAPMPDISMGRGFGSLKVPDSILDEMDARRHA